MHQITAWTTNDSVLTLFVVTRWQFLNAVYKHFSQRHTIENFKYNTENAMKMSLS